MLVANAAGWLTWVSVKRRTRYPAGVQVELAGAIILECLAPAVAAISVRFDHEMVSGPEEVDGVRANGGVDLGHRKAVSATEIEERTLQLSFECHRSRSHRAKARGIRPGGVGLADHARRLHVAKIGEGAGRVVDRDAVADGPHAWDQVKGAMDGARRAYVDPRRSERSRPLERGGEEEAARAQLRFGG